MVQTSLQPSRSKPTNLLDLPTEVRINEIYQYLVPAPGEIRSVQPWHAQSRKSKRKHTEIQAGGGNGDERNKGDWHWTVLLRVNKEMHDEVAHLVYCNMELCLLLTTDPTLNENYNAFSQPGEMDPIIEDLLSPDYEIRWLRFWKRNNFCEYNMLPEPQRKRQQTNTNQSLAPPNQILPSASSHPSASTQFSSSTQLSSVQTGPFTQPQTQPLVTTPTGSAPIPPNITGPPGPVTSQPPLQPSMQQRPMTSEECQKLRILDRVKAEREAGIFLSYFMRVKRDAWLNEVCMGWEDEMKARIVQICHSPVFTPRRLSKITMPKSPENWEPTVAARYRGLIRRVRLVMDVVDTRESVAHAGFWLEYFGAVYNEKETVSALMFAVWDVLENLLGKRGFSDCEMEIEMHVVGFGRPRVELWNAVRLLLKPFEFCAGKMNISFKSLVTLDLPLDGYHPRFVLVRDGMLTDELKESDDRASQLLVGCLKEWQTKVSEEVRVDANKDWKLPYMVKTCRSLDKSLCDVFGSYSTSSNWAPDSRLRELRVWSSQAKIAIAEENLFIFLVTWGNILLEIDDELKNQVGDETLEQTSLEQSPRLSMKPQQRKELGQGQKTEGLRDKLLKLIDQIQADLEVYDFYAKFGIELKSRRKGV